MRYLQKFSQPEPERPPGLKRLRRSLIRAIGSAAMAAIVLTSMVVTPIASIARAQPAPLPDKPFAEHRIVLQLSDRDAGKEGLVISIAYNLLKLYDPDKVAIEVVAFGPGIDLLRPDNSNRKLVESLVAQGVRFDICLNTVDTIERETGKRPEFIAAATPVQVGVGQILSLTENGYTLVRP
jgi:intracellular sulfur oxidation DsrE/DsrF family protein